MDPKLQPFIISSISSIREMGTPVISSTDGCGLLPCSSVSSADRSSWSVLGLSWICRSEFSAVMVLLGSTVITVRSNLPLLLKWPRGYMA